MSSATIQQSIRALYVLDQVNRGGIEMQALDAVKAAQERDIELTIVTTGGRLLDEFQCAADVVVLKRRLPVDLVYTSQLRRLVWERNCNIVQGHQAVDALHLLIATRRLPVKRILTIEGFIPDQKNRRTLKFLIPRMDAVVFPSEALRTWIGKHDHLEASSNAVIIPNGADPARLDDRTGDLRSELNLKSGAFLIGMVGNFYRGPRKDQITFIKSFAAVNSAHPNTYCLIVGGVEPGAEDKLNVCKSLVEEYGIADHVYFLGSRNDIPAVLRSLDVFVLSSLHEGGSPPIAIIEAMLCRVPVIASDIAPHVEYATPETSVLFTAGDESDLALKVNTLINDADRRNQLADSAYTHAMTNFTARARLEHFRKLYERLLAE